eukprot:scpid84829/ scgid26796/ 
MNAGTVALTFDEVVDHLELSTTALLLQSANAVSTNSLNLTAGSVATVAAPSTVLVFPFLASDLTAIKANENLFVSANTSFISYTNALVKDTTGNALEARNLSAALEGKFVKDSTRPSAQNFLSLDMNTGKLRLKFNEPMATRGIVYTGITLRSTATATTPVFTLRGGSAVHVTRVGTTTTEKTEIEITMTPADVQEIKLLTGLATRKENSFVTIDAGSFKDLHDGSGGNGINALTTGLEAGVFTADVISPKILNFTLDVDSGSLVLYFDDVMNASSLISTRLQLQSTTDSDTTKLSLSGGTTASTVGYNITWQLSTLDLNLLKLKSGLGTSTANTFLRANGGAVSDVAGVPSIALLREN